MEEALKSRKAARDSFCRIRKELGLNDGDDFEMSLRDLALEKGKNRFLKFLRRQRRFLDAVTSVIKNASFGHQILDAVSLCEKQGLDPNQYDIAAEIGQLFHSGVSKPTSKLRSYVDKKVNSKLGKFAKTLIQNIVAQPIEMLIEAGNTILSTYLNLDDHSQQKKRLRESAVRILMHLSDCFRYRFDCKTAQNMAEIMLYSESKNPEAYMRMAMNAGVATDFAQDITPFFHYCVFLDNRNVLIEHAEAKVVHLYVKEMLNGRGSRPDSVRSTAILMFVDAIWGLISGDMKNASRKVRDETLWKSLTKFVKEATGKDILYMIGAFMFAHYRSTTEANDNSEHNLHCELADYALSRLVTVLADAVAEKLKEVKTLVRSRKKNRRRSIQKKRKKKDPNHISGDGAEIVAYEALNYVGPIEERVPHLGALSFITHYWASRKVHIRHPPDTQAVANTLQGLQTVVNEIRLINEMTFTLSLSQHLENRTLKNSRALPPLFEDSLFCNLSLCEKLGLFRDVRVSRVTFESLFNSEPPNLRNIIHGNSTTTYESIVQTTAARYIRAFSLQCAREAKVNVDELGVVATISIVASIIRKQRISNLISELEKFGGGKLARMLIQVPKFGEAQRLDFERDGSLSPPLPGQRPFEECQNVQDNQESVDIEALLTKRRRLIGSFTPGQSKAQYTIENEGESDAIARASSLSSGHREACLSAEPALRHPNCAQTHGKGATIHANRSSKELSGLSFRTRRPMDTGKVSIRDEPLLEETKSTTLSLLKLIYPDHTNSVSHLCCEDRDDPDWRTLPSELHYANVTTFPALDAP
ncbi:hypothetical protein FGB62_22g822 [Gracilaria domingensis]|nr:hypothetical protein FGB62_22g822 [Gracilaria domingensis]